MAFAFSVAVTLGYPGMPLWASGHNVFAIPLAAGVLASRGFLLPPILAALLISAAQ